MAARIIGPCREVPGVSETNPQILVGSLDVRVSGQVPDGPALHSLSDLQRQGMEVGVDRSKASGNFGEQEPFALALIRPSSDYST
jgi:hypothetical protein